LPKVLPFKDSLIKLAKPLEAEESFQAKKAYEEQAGTCKD